MATQVKTKGYIRTEQLDKKSSACGCSYSNINGSDPIDVRSFQNWANINKNAGLDVDGKYGPKTTAAYNLYGATWEATKLITKDSQKQAETEKKPSQDSTPLSKSPVSLIEKWKALTPVNKGLVIGGGVLVTTLVFVLVWKLIPKK